MHGHGFYLAIKTYLGVNPDAAGDERCDEWGDDLAAERAVGDAAVNVIVDRGATRKLILIFWFCSSFGVFASPNLGDLCRRRVVLGRTSIARTDLGLCRAIKSLPAGSHSKTTSR